LRRGRLQALGAELEAGNRGNNMSLSEVAHAVEVFADFPFFRAAERGFFAAIANVARA